MLRPILTRVGAGTLTLWAFSLALFVGTELLPGDPARAVLGREATLAEIAAVREEFGLDRPVLERYMEWLSGFVHGDLGRAFPAGDPVTQIVGDRLRNTAVLAAATIALLIPLSVLFGVLAAMRPDRLLDQIVTSTTLGMFATPEFVVGSMLIALFSFWLGWLPPVSLIDPERSIFSRPSIFLLPIVTLLSASVAQTIRMIRATMIDVLQSPYIELARLKGVPMHRLLLWHALPNALGPTIQIMAINIAWLVGGVVVVESVFDYRGVGLALTEAVSRRDIAIVQAIGMSVAAVYIGVNLLADVCVILLNPRLRRSR